MTHPTRHGDVAALLRAANGNRGPHAARECRIRAITVMCETKYPDDDTTVFINWLSN